MAQSSRPDDGRPDPDALLAAARRETVGRLKVFVGAAPGVGKTYAMLQGARRLKDEGVDVVVGLVETHGRAETGALSKGSRFCRAAWSSTAAVRSSEFDIDAALERKPRLIVVDELAHTNAPDSRHPKRWQDVQELLDAGINVWTALNIQHLESLADVVSRITGVAVRETVPDRVLQEAADVVLVDITPDELIQRLNEGKVYVPETARRATPEFLHARQPDGAARTGAAPHGRPGRRPDGRLSAPEGDRGPLGRLGAPARLRRRRRSLRARRPPGGAARDLASTPPGPRSRSSRSRGGGRTRRRTRSPRPSGSSSGSAATRCDCRAATTRPRSSASPAARTSRRSCSASRGRACWRACSARSLPEELIRQAGTIEVHVVSSEEARPRLATARADLRPEGLNAEIVAALASVACAVCVGEALTAVLRLPNLSMIFLTAVLFSGVRFGTRAAVIASFASFVGLQFLLHRAALHLHGRPAAGALRAAHLSRRRRADRLARRPRARPARKRDQERRDHQSLYDYSRKLSGASSADDVLWAAAAHLHATFGGRIVLLVGGGRRSPDPRGLAARRRSSTRPR